LENCNKLEGRDERDFGRLEQLLRASLRREAQEIQPKAQAFWVRFVTKPRKKT